MNQTEMIYQYDGQTKEYTGCYERIITGMRINLSDRTRVPVSPPKEGFTRVFDEEEQRWLYQEDFRGKMQYNIQDKSASIIDYIGGIKEGYTCLEPLPYTSFIEGAWGLDHNKYLDDVKENKRTEINHERTEAELSGFTYQGHIFDSDRDSILRISNAAQAAQMSLSTGDTFRVDWTLKDNRQIALDAITMIKVQLAMVAHIDQCHEQARFLKAEIEKAETIDAVLAIQWMID